MPKEKKIEKEEIVKEIPLEQYLRMVGRGEEVDFVNNTFNTCVDVFKDIFTMKGKEEIISTSELQKMAEDFCVVKLQSFAEDITLKRFPFKIDNEINKALIKDYILPIINEVRKEAVGERREYRLLMLSKALEKWLAGKGMSDYEKRVWIMFHPEEVFTPVKKMKQKKEEIEEKEDGRTEKKLEVEIFNKKTGEVVIRKLFTTGKDLYKFREEFPERYGGDYDWRMKK